MPFKNNGDRSKNDGPVQVMYIYAGGIFKTIPVIFSKIMGECKGYKLLLVEYLILAITYSVTVGNETIICLERTVYSTSTACPSEPHIPCVNGQRIRIDYINFYKSNSTTGNCNSTCTSGRHAWEVQGDDLLKIHNFIYQQCSYTRTCHLNHSVYTPASLDQTIWLIEIGYTYIEEGEFLHFCSSIDTVVNGSLQLVMGRAPQPCFCIIPEYANITVVEYTPCFFGLCSESKVYFNRVQRFDCGTQCNFTTYHNVRMNISDTSTNITVENINTDTLFWISVTDNSGTNASVKCNTNRFDVVQTPTSNLSPCTEITTTEINNVGTTVTRDVNVTNVVQTSTSSLVSSSETITTENNDVATTVIRDVNVTSNTDIPTTTSDELDTGQQPQAQIFPVSVVVGGVVGSTAAAVIIIAVIMFMRRARARNAASETSNQYNEEVFHPETQSKSRGVTNEAYGEAVDVKFTDGKLNGDFNHLDTAKKQRGDNSAKTLQRTDYEYAILTNADNSITSASSVIYSKVDKLGQTHQETDIDEVNTDYAEPYTKPDEVDYTMYGGTGQHPANVSAYDTFAGSDEYSHINAAGKYPILPTSDNYSHLPLPSGDTRKKVTVNADQGMDTYNHITVNAENQTADTKSSHNGNDYNVENVEYDSCASF